MQSQSFNQKASSVGRVVVGSQVQISLRGGEIRNFKIVDSSNSGMPEQGTISKDSPLGRALLARAVGEKAIYMVGEKLMSAEILSVQG
jgi:transcription elongation GreA/GreB family factor